MNDQIIDLVLEEIAKYDDLTEERMFSRWIAVFFFFLFCSVLVLPVSALDEGKVFKVRVGMAGIDPGMSAVWMAKEKGFFEEENVRVELVNFASGTEGIFAVASGDIPITAVGGIAAVRGMVAGLDIKFLAELLESAPYSLLISPKLNTPSDLIGKKVGISGFGATSEYVTGLILAGLKLDTAKVTILPAGDEATRLAALVAGSIDATALQPPCSTIARRLGFREYPDHVEGILGAQDYLVASGHALAQDREPFLRLVRAVLKGSNYFKTHPDEGRVCLAKYLQIEDSEVISETCDIYRRLLTADGSLNRGCIQHLLDFIEDERSRTVKPESLIETDLIDKMERNGEIEPISKQPS